MSTHLSPIQVFLVFLRLGLTSFGGPVAHLGYFREAFVERLKWMNDRSYADLVALCQFLPGPASSQVGIGVGLMKAGPMGGLAAWLGFTLPSALLLIGFGYGVTLLQGELPDGVLSGLKIVAVAVVAQAVLGMARTLTPDLQRAAIAIAAAALMLLVPGPFSQIAVMIGGALVGIAFLRSRTEPIAGVQGMHRNKTLAGFALAGFAALLVGLPLLASTFDSHALTLFDGFYRAGSLVFGGGHVVLPLLQAEVVPPGWISNDEFLAGYGATQAVPGPLFTFAAYLGTVMAPTPHGWVGALVCLVAIFLPSFLLVYGALPFWESLRAQPRVQQALLGVNAAVVGLLLAALVDPVWTSAIFTWADFGLAAAAFGTLQILRVPPWAVVLMTALAGWALGALA